jgi:hypothetical protein
MALERHTADEKNAQYPTLDEQYEQNEQYEQKEQNVNFRFL